MHGVHRVRAGRRSGRSAAWPTDGLRHAARTRSRCRGAAVALTLAAILGFAPHGIAAPSFESGRTAFVDGRYREAVAALAAYVETRPRDAEAWTWLGAAYYHLNQFIQAEEALRYALAIRPSGEVALWLGAVEVGLGKVEPARQAFTLAARLGRPQTALWARQWLRMVEGQAMPVLPKGASPEAYAYVVRWYNRALTPTQVDAIVRSVLYYSAAYEVDPRLMMALIAVESGFQITARSPAGAYGLGQLMPETWRAMRVHPGDPVANIYASVRVLRGQLDRFGGDPALALAAYNAGRGAVERYTGIPPYNETQWYVYNVLTLYRHLTGGRPTSWHQNCCQKSLSNRTGMYARSS